MCELRTSSSPGPVLDTGDSIWVFSAPSPPTPYLQRKQNDRMWVKTLRNWWYKTWTPNLRNRQSSNWNRKTPTMLASLETPQLLLVDSEPIKEHRMHLNDNRKVSPHPTSKNHALIEKPHSNRTLNQRLSLTPLLSLYKMHFFQTPSSLWWKESDSSWLSYHNNVWTYSLCFILQVVCFLLHAQSSHQVWTFSLWTLIKICAPSWLDGSPSGSNDGGDGNSDILMSRGGCVVKVVRLQLWVWWQAVWPWASYIISLWPSSLSGKVGITVGLTWRVPMRIKWAISRGSNKMCMQYEEHRFDTE